MRASSPTPSYMTSVLVLPTELPILMQETGLGKYCSWELEAPVGKDIIVMKMQERQKRTGRKKVESVVTRDSLTEQRMPQSGN